MADGPSFNSMSLGGRGGTGFVHEVFITILRGLSGAKVTKPGDFHSNQDGYAVKSSLNSEDGVLYPREKSFFCLPKPPTLILHEEIDYVEFERHAAGGSHMHYFDLLIRLETDQDYLFRDLQRNEYQSLFDFISIKGLEIMNLGSAKTTEGVAAVLQNDDDDAVDPHLERIKKQLEIRAMKRMKILLLTRMMEAPLLMIQGKENLMAVTVERRKRYR